MTTIKSKKSIYEIIQTWYWCLEYFNVDDIIWLFKNSQSEIRIKKSKFLSFYKTYKLAELKKKISCQLMWKFKQYDKFLHFNMINDEKFLENSDDFISNFLEAKYFILIINNII